MNTINKQKIADSIRAILDYPKPDVIFRDITTLIGNAEVFAEVIEILKNRYVDKKLILSLVLKQGGLFLARL